jgi:hypothetical protein
MDHYITRELQQSMKLPGIEVDLAYIYFREKRKANWIGHILRRNCLMKQVIEEKIKGR